MALEALGTSVRTFMRKSSLGAQLALLDRAWSQEVGALAGLAQIAALEHATLIVHVSSSAAMQEVMLRRKELVRRLNRHFESPFIANLIVKMGHE